MNLKNGMIAIFLLAAGMTNAQVQNPPPRMVSPQPPAPTVIEEGSETKKGEIVDFPDVDAEFPGGAAEMTRFIQENVEYPEIAREKGYQGRVYVTFIVEIDGSVSGVDILRDAEHQSLSDEAMRLVRIMPKWSPGEMNGTPVRARCRLPITFTLEGDAEEAPKKKRLFRR